MIQRDARDGSARLLVRTPNAHDGSAVFQCIRDWGGLDENSPYAYMLLCDRFSEYCAIGELDGQVAGFVMGLAPADAPNTLFVWQVGVAPEARGMRVAAKLIEHILQRLKARYLEAHVGSQNTASEALFRGIARRHEAEVVETVAYPSEWFPPGHDTERLLRIGPLRSE